MPAGESYLVVGGCGFLGRHIVEQLLERGEQQVAVFDIVQRHFDDNVTFYIGDIAKAEDVSDAIRKSGATCIIHTASPAHGAGRRIYELVNVTGTSTIIDCCENSTVRKLVYTSSAGTVYNGTSDNIDVDERLTYPEVALDAYNETKVAAEKMVLAANSESLLTCAIRPSGIFGPGDRQMISGFYSVVKNGQTKYQIGNNTNLADFTYVANVAHAHLLAADKLGTVYPYAAFSDALPTVDLSTGMNQRIPTSDARPLGPATEPTAADIESDKRFRSAEYDPQDQRPVLRNRMDHFSEPANNESDGGMPIAGQAYFVTNGEPIYFWDFARTIWKQLGHTPPYTIAIPVGIGLFLAMLAEAFSKLLGKEPGFTKFRVTHATQQRYYAIEKSKRMLGYEPIVGLDEGMKRWTQWYAGELEKQKALQEDDKTK